MDGNLQASPTIQKEIQVDERVSRGRPKLKARLRGRPSVLGRDSLHDALLARLRRMIQEGALAPGEQIVETGLCEYFGVSRTPLREALKVLASEGLVELRPRRTPIVTPVDPAEIAAIFEVLEGLEAVAGRRACENMTDAAMSELDVLHAEMIAEHDRGDRSAYQAKNRTIHFQIVDLAANPVLKATYANFMTRVMRARATNNYDAARWPASRAEHEEIMAALRRRDPQGAADALARHTRATGASVLATLKRFGAPTGAGG
jgi:DNA-binding GntR family transcriptional regulator